MDRYERTHDAASPTDDRRRLRRLAGRLPGLPAETTGTTTWAGGRAGSVRAYELTGEQRLPRPSPRRSSAYHRPVRGHQVRRRHLVEERRRRRRQRRTRRTWRRTARRSRPRSGSTRRPGTQTLPGHGRTALRLAADRTSTGTGTSATTSAGTGTVHRLRLDLQPGAVRRGRAPDVSGHERRSSTSHAATRSVDWAIANLTVAGTFVNEGSGDTARVQGDPDPGHP